MCGLAGIVNFDGQEPRAAERLVRCMADQLVHRGPDADGYYVDETAALAHRRLSIIDIETGSQPMAAADGRVQIVFNGEIYDFALLREDLEKRGHGFKTSSDTEVILRAYLEWGEDCVSRLNGMFAFAIWDARHRRLFVARDRVGKKPLYYRYDGREFAFASELKALRAAGRAGGIDREAVDCYLTMGYIPAPKTIYSDVRKLGAGQAMSVSEGGTRINSYWTLQFGQPRPRSMEDAADELEGLLDDAVRSRLVADVPLGAFLSGGIDSSLVVSSMSKFSGSPVKTNSVGFDVEEISELGSAREIAAHLGTQHREFVVAPDASQVLDRIAWHLDEPFADSSALATWYVCQMTRESVTVALSGDGGDEAFGGYTFRYAPHMAESAVRHALPSSLRYALFGPLGRAWPASARLPRALRLKSILENLATGDATAYYRDLVTLREDQRGRLYRPEFMQDLCGFTPFEVVHPYYSRGDAPDPVSRSQYSDINVYMTDDVLVKVDRMSMAHSLEVRSPLLDHRILEFAATLPRRLKLNLAQGKLVLRELARKRLPEGIGSLPKRGFSIPAAEWLRGDLREMAEHRVLSGAGLIGELLDQAAIRGLWKQHLDRSRDHSSLFWALLMLALWEESAGSVVPRAAA